MPDATTRPPREDVFRALPNAIEVRTSTDGGMPTLAGHFAVFDQWTEINSMWEGNFLERVAPGAFQKTIRESKDQMRVLFNHGQDASTGDKVLGPISVLREEPAGPYYEVPLLDTIYNRELVPGLEAGLYGASFRFRVMREEMVDTPKPSKTNPRGLPERTIKEAAVSEFGPVTFPAYAGATAGLRSLTDEFLFGRFMDDPERLQALLDGRKNKGILVPEQRADMPSVSLLTQMYELGQEFIEAENDTDDADDRDAMAQILTQIEALVKAEADEPSDMPADTPVETNSNPAPGTGRAAEEHPSSRAASHTNDLFWFVPKPTQGAK